MTVKSLKHSSLTDNVFYRSMLAGNAGFVPSDEDVLDEVVLTSSAASVTFSGLDTLAAGYEHLQVRMTGRSNGAVGANAVYAYLNGDSSASYASHRLQANGSAVSSSAYTGGGNGWIGYMAGNNGTANVFGALVADFLDFSSSSKNTTWRALGGNPDPTTDDYVGLYSGVYLNTAAMTSLTLFHGTGSWVSGSRFTLIGLK